MTFGLAYCDHVVLYRFTPRGLHSTDCEITWLVNESAVEGKDYDVADAHLALGRHDDRGQDRSSSATRRAWIRASTSRARCRTMEDYQRQFLEWYVATMRA